MAESIKFRGQEYLSKTSLWNDLRIDVSPKGENRDILRSSLKETNGVRWMNLREITEAIASKISAQSEDMAALFDVLRLGVEKHYPGVKFSATSGNLQNPFRNGKKGRKAADVHSLDELLQD